MPTATANRNYYEILGVPRGAKLAYVRRRYLTLTQEVHPDRFSEPDEKARKADEFKWINEAWEVLSSHDQRARYDSSLDAGGEFVPSAGSAKTAESIFNDAKRFEFNCLAALPDSLRQLVGEQLKGVKEFDHRIVATFPLRASTVGRSPLTTPCGASHTAYLILTNMRLSVGVVGKSSTQKGNTQYSMTYTRLASVYFGAVERFDIAVSFEHGESVFSVRVNAPESAFSGIDFTCEGSPFVFLWIADLFDIRTNLSIRRSAPGSPLGALAVAVCGVAAGVVMMLGTGGLMNVTGLALAASFALHGVAEWNQVSGTRRLIQYCESLAGRRAPNHQPQSGSQSPVPLS